MADRENGPLSGRTALVVGTSPNIGGGIAIELGRAGAAVGCVDREPRNAEGAVNDLRELGAKAIAITADATDPAAVEGVVDEVADALGQVDLLVNGAVSYDVRGVLDMDIAGWRRLLSIVLDSAFLYTGSVVRRLAAAGDPGTVINVVSTAGHQGEPNNIAYTTAKGGLLNMTRSAAIELAPHRIRVNSLTPTATDLTEWDERAQRWDVPGPPEPFRTSLDAARAQIPLQELPRPSDYGRAAVFLASDAARLVTGVDLPVDAGSLANYWRTKPVGGP